MHQMSRVLSIATAVAILLAPVPASATENSGCEILTGEVNRLGEAWAQTMRDLHDVSAEIDTLEREIQRMMPTSDLIGEEHRRDGDAAFDFATAFGNNAGGVIVGTIQLQAMRQVLDRIRAAETRARTLLNALDLRQGALDALLRIRERVCAAEAAVTQRHPPGIRNGLYQGSALINAAHDDCTADSYTAQIQVTDGQFAGLFHRHGGALDGQPFEVNGTVEPDGQLIATRVGGINNETFEVAFISGGILGEWYGGGCMLTFALGRVSD